jgi:hypothetical protein
LLDLTREHLQLTGTKKVGAGRIFKPRTARSQFIAAGVSPIANAVHATGKRVRGLPNDTGQTSLTVIDRTLAEKVRTCVSHDAARPVF